jgi:hypothetical protein
MIPPGILATKMATKKISDIEEIRMFRDEGKKFGYTPKYFYLF